MFLKINRISFVGSLTLLSSLFYHLYVDLLCFGFAFLAVTGRNLGEFLFTVSGHSESV